MSSRPFYAPVLLNTKDYGALRTTAPTVNDWFKDWEHAVGESDPQKLINLLHWGLQNALQQGKAPEIEKMICHYLAVADGHDSRENFGYVPNFAIEFLNSPKSLDELKQQIADKAWMELCNRLFTLSESSDYGGLKYWSSFAEPPVAEAFIRFIDVHHWNMDGHHHSYQNVDKQKNCAYHRKALACTKQFLANAWQYKQLWLRYYCREGVDEKFWERWKFFLSRRPKLVSLMYYYGMLDFLYDQKLDSKSRQQLRRMAYTSGYIADKEVPAETPALQELYGQCDERSGHLIPINRTAARILMMYPLLVAGRRKYVAAWVAKQAQAKAAKIAQLEEDLWHKQKQLEELK